MPNSPEDHAQAMLDHQGAIEAIKYEASISRVISIIGDARNAHPQRVIGALHPEVIGAGIGAVANIPLLAIDRVLHTAKAAYHQRLYARHHGINHRHTDSQLFVEAEREEEGEQTRNLL